MEEQARLLASRNGYKGHVASLFNKINDFCSGEFDDYSATSLRSAVEQLTSKLNTSMTSYSNCTPMQVN